jgi:hypothetical protein
MRRRRGLVEERGHESGTLYARRGVFEQRVRKTQSERERGGDERERTA